MKEYNFKINNDPEKWDQQFISGEQIRSIPPGIPDSMDLFLKRRNEPGVLVGKDEKIDLTDPGIEKFYTQDASSEAGAE
jgi:hypothetical protein